MFCTPPSHGGASEDSLYVFQHMVSVVNVLWRVGAVVGDGMEYREKIMLHYFPEMKCQYGVS